MHSSQFQYARDSKTTRGCVHITSKRPIQQRSHRSAHAASRRPPKSGIALRWQNGHTTVPQFLTAVEQLRPPARTLVGQIRPSPPCPSRNHAPRQQCRRTPYAAWKTPGSSRVSRPSRLRCSTQARARPGTGDCGGSETAGMRRARRSATPSGVR
ncbi:unnamed protein product [Mycena citricolor]|uniref:Uncharacterized protein n=1 Tax=Mycena citricolor TaxID=2018698 RepID=A0AAD2H362_9AGAR|nr:unnamed protein product [Mycena citricolor]CAK5273691.1 unnamed protein product [Mycena citricolor]